MTVAVRAWTVLAIGGLTVAPAVAANPPTGQHILSSKTVEPDEIRLVAEFLATTDGSAPKGSIVDEALDLFRKNPTANYRELAIELARRHQELTAPDKFDNLVDLFQGLQNQAGPLGQFLRPPSSDTPGTDSPENPFRREGLSRREGTTRSEGTSRSDNDSPARSETSPRQDPRLSSRDAAPSAQEPSSANTTKKGDGASSAKGKGPTTNPPKSASDSRPKKESPPSESKAKSPARTTERPLPPPSSAQPEGGFNRRRMMEQIPELPSFLENLKNAEDTWQAHQQKMKAEADNRLKRQRQFDAVRGLWESNFGDLNDTPAIKELLHEMFAGPNPIAPEAAEGLLALLGDPTANPNNFMKWVNSQSGVFEDIARVNPFSRSLGGLSFSGLEASSSSSGALNYQPSAIAGEGSWVSVILFLLVAGGALVAWRFWPRGSSLSHSPRGLVGLGPWPVDPRTVTTRSDLIQAFEYLSVLLCGSQARTANHLALADALQQITGSRSVAEPLAHTYALARYTPVSEPLPPETIAEARQHLCRLAGVTTP